MIKLNRHLQGTLLSLVPLRDNLLATVPDLLVLIPAEVEGENWLLYSLLCQHAVKNRVSKDLCQWWVSHPQNTIELGHHKCGTGLVDWLAKLLVQDGHATDLDWKTRLIMASKWGSNQIFITVTVLLLWNPHTTEDDASSCLIMIFINRMKN